MTPERYAETLAATGMEEREVGRAYFFVQKYGMERVERSDSCLAFSEPSCGNWDCVNPEHQRLQEAS